MVLTDEEKKTKRKDCNKKYYLKNKEKIKEQQKAYILENKDKMKTYRIANDDNIKERNEKVAEQRKEQNKAYRLKNKDKIKEKDKAYRQTEEGIKSNKMKSWRFIGVDNVNDELYDYYMNCDKCEVCGKEFKDSYDKCLDHNHDTGEFRYVLCRACNTWDSWKKKNDV